MFVSEKQPVLGSFVLSLKSLLKHDQIDIINLHVIKAYQSLTSRGCLKAPFSWRWYYTFTLEELDFL